MTTCGAISSELQGALAAARSAALAAAALLGPQAGRVHRTVAKEDGSPVTEFDLEADRLIQDRLRQAFPADPVVSEESPGAAPPEEAERFWLVDPLDGTRDFAAGSPEFAVHIALVVAGRPVVSVVHQPATGTLFEAVQGTGAFREAGGRRRPIRVSAADELEAFRIGVSRRSAGEGLSRLLAETPLGRNAVPLGASLKLTAVAAGELEGTLCLHGREKIWDSCAPALIVLEAGGAVTDVDGRSLRYRSSDLLHRRGIVTSNGRCHEALCSLAGRYWPPA
jgi:3'(2'), 5'-bisphosphate nucleotidase